MNVSKARQKFCERTERNIMSDELGALARQIRENTQLMQSSREEWKNAMIQLAIALWKARQHFPSNHEFGLWLAENDLDDLSRDDRAALINMAEPEHLEFTKRVFEEMESNSIRLLWAETERRVRSVANTTLAQIDPPKVEEMPSPTVQSSNGAAEKDENPAQRRDLSAKSSLRKHPRAEEVWATYKNEHTKAELNKAMSKRSSGNLWELILIAIDNGFLKPTSACTHREGFTARMLFPEAPPRGEFSTLLLVNAKTREFVQTVIMPVAIACRDQILSEPHRVEEICNEYRRKRQTEKHAKIEQEKHAIALSKLPAGHQEIIAYGEVLWPYEPNGANDYDWDQVRAACWYFVCLRDTLEVTHASPKSIAITLRHSIKFLLEYCAHRQKGLEKARDVIRLVKHITFLWEAQPESRCNWPHFPIGGIEGKWD